MLWHFTIMIIHSILWIFHIWVHAETHCLYGVCSSLDVTTHHRTCKELLLIAPWGGSFRLIPSNACRSVCSFKGETSPSICIHVMTSIPQHLLISLKLICRFLEFLSYYPTLLLTASFRQSQVKCTSNSEPWNPFCKNCCCRVSSWKNNGHPLWFWVQKNLLSSEEKAAWKYSNSLNGHWRIFSFTVEYFICLPPTECFLHSQYNLWGVFNVVLYFFDWVVNLFL